VAGIVVASVFLTKGKTQADQHPAATVSATTDTGKSASPGPAKPTSAEDALAQGSTDKAPLSPDTLFPDATVTVDGRTYTRSAVDASTNCGDGSTNGLGPQLDAQQCRFVYRATYTSDSSLITLGYFVFDDQVQASKVDGALKGNVRPLVTDPIPHFCGDTSACALSHKSLGRYIYMVVAGSKAQGTATPGDPAVKQAAADVFKNAENTLMARGTQESKTG
jgi:hypothetical protein